MNTAALAHAEPEADEAVEADDQAVVDAGPDDDEEQEAPGLALYLTGEPPDDMNVDTAGLPPQRARLARYQAWVARTKAELDALETGRARFLESVGAPAVTEEKIAALIESDRLGLVSWMRSGAAGITPAQIRSFERQKLEEALDGDRHASEVAKAALDDVEREIRERRQQAEALEQRRDAFANDAVIEVVEAIGAQYRRQAEEMHETLTQLLGANAAIGTLGYMESLPKGVKVRLPTFKLSSLGAWRDFGIEVDRREIQIASGPWRQLARLWAEDARAAPSNAMANSSAIDTTLEAEPLPEHLQMAVETVVRDADGGDWYHLATALGERIALLRSAAENGESAFVEGETDTLVAAVIECVGETEVNCTPQARVMSFSATPAHRIAAAAWFEQHPNDRPADDADIVDALL